MQGVPESARNMNSTLTLQKYLFFDVLTYKIYLKPQISVIKDGSYLHNVQSLIGLSQY